MKSVRIDVLLVIVALSSVACFGLFGIVWLASRGLAVDPSLNSVTSVCVGALGAVLTSTRGREREGDRRQGDSERPDR